MITIDEIIRSKRKSIALIVERDGRLVVRAPRRVSQEFIHAFVNEKESWIIKKQTEFKSTHPKFAPKEFVEGEGMFLFLDQKGIYVSSGSACASTALKMSHVLTAIKVDTAVGQGSILLTLSKYNTEEDIDFLLAEFPPIVAKLRYMSPLYSYFQKTGQRRVAGPGTDYEHEHEHEEIREDG